MMVDILVLSFDIPWPDDYGGMKDVWQRLMLMKSQYPEARIDVVASYRAPERLERFNSSPQREEIDRFFAYRQEEGWRALLPLPASVATRRLSADDLTNVKAVLKPRYDLIIVETMKCYRVYRQLRPLIEAQAVILRVHNIEADYYRALGQAETRLARRAFMAAEAARYGVLERLSPLYRQFDKLWFISAAEFRDERFYGDPEKKCWMPPVIMATASAEKDTPGFDARHDMALYVGNLDLADNRIAAAEVVRDLDPLLRRGEVELVMAGQCSDAAYARALEAAAPGVSVKPRPSDAELHDLYNRAKVFFCYAANPGGTKLKLYDAMRHGLPVVANPHGCTGSGLENVVIPSAAVRSSAAVLQRLFLDPQHWEERRQATIAAFQETKTIAEKELRALIRLATSQRGELQTDKPAAAR
jgi:glycosyltransferase involved in cell wall biosynthesis